MEKFPTLLQLAEKNSQLEQTLVQVQGQVRQERKNNRQLRESIFSLQTDYEEIEKKLEDAEQTIVQLRTNKQASVDSEERRNAQENIARPLRHAMASAPSTPRSVPPLLDSLSTVVRSPLNR